MTTKTTLAELRAEVEAKKTKVLYDLASWEREPQDSETVQAGMANCLLKIQACNWFLRLIAAKPKAEAAKTEDGQR